MNLRLFLTLMGLISTVLPSTAFSADVAWPFSDPSRTIRGPEECRQRAKAIDDTLTRYQQGAAGNMRVWNELKKSLKDDGGLNQRLHTYSYGDDACTNKLQAFYALSSLAAMRRVHFVKDGKLTSVANTQYEGIIDLAIELFESDRLVAFDDKMRNEWGGAWKDSKNKILGAYQCEETKIYFDSTLLPYNLAGILIHEFDHLLRDKIAFDEHWSTYSQDIPTTLLLDETLATLDAGFAQLAFRRDNNREAEGEASNNFSVLMSAFWNMNESGSAANPRTRRYNLLNDLNLFDPKGNLYGLWKKKVKTGGFKLGATFYDFMSEGVMEGARATSSETTKRLDNILQIVSGAYFDSDRPSTERARETLQRWWEGNSRDVALSGSRPAQDLVFLVRGRLNRVSEGCLEISKAMREQRVPGYIGSKLSLPEHDGFMAGGEGGRPGGEGGRTSTGGEGGRPGQGIKPARPFSPCLKPSEKI